MKLSPRKKSRYEHFTASTVEQSLFIVHKSVSNIPSGQVLDTDLRSWCTGSSCSLPLVMVSPMNGCPLISYRKKYLICMSHYRFAYTITGLLSSAVVLSFIQRCDTYDRSSRCPHFLKNKLVWQLLGGVYIPVLAETENRDMVCSVLQWW